MVSLDPRDREHHGNQRQDPARAVKKCDAAIRVVLAHDLDQTAVLAGVVDEVVEVAEGIDHDVQPDQAHQADDEHLDELAQQVAINDREHAKRETMACVTDVANLASAARPHQLAQIATSKISCVTKYGS